MMPNYNMYFNIFFLCIS